MITEFILKNLSTLEEVKFGQDIDCDYVYESGGIDWNSIPATHSTYNYPNQIGDSFSSSKINNRDITIEAYAYYILSEDEKQIYNRNEWYDYGYEKIKEKKEVLNRLINPLDFVRMTIGDYYIEGKPSATVKYGVTEAENNIYFCKFLITIFCANPMFKKITQQTSLLSGDYGSFFFPFFVKPTGYIFGVRNNYLMLVVENEGNSKVGGIITLTAKAEVVNPTIENIDTGEKMRVLKTMQAGDTIIINTSDGEDKGIWGIINGELVTFIKYWNFTINSWIKFEPGQTVIGYSTDNQSETSLDIKIEINPEKYGLEVM